jgi:hypothetical protein
MPKKSTMVSTPELPGAPRWVAEVVERYWGALVAVAGADRVPSGPAATPVRASDDGKESVTLATRDPSVCLRITASAHEAGFAAAMLSERAMPAGFARPLGVVRLPTKLRGHNTFAVWREALLLDADLPTWEKVGPFRRHLDLFQRASAAALKTLRWPGGPEAMVREAWAMVRTPKGHVTAEQVATPEALAATLRALSGARRAAVALSAARLAARLLERTPGGELVGAGLGYWLDRGMLLDGIDGACLGTARRDGKPKAVIVEPGAPCLFDPTYGSLRIEPLLEAMPLAPARRPNPGDKSPSGLSFKRAMNSVNLIGYKVMGWDPAARRLVSLADPSLRYPSQLGSRHSAGGHGIYLANSRDFVLSHYAIADVNALVTYEFHPESVVSGNLYDREAVVTVRSAVVVSVELYDEDGARIGQAAP